MSAVAHCAVVRNPFSTAVTHAKLPDGAVSMSSSCRYSISTEVVDSSGFVDILILPGFTTPIIWRSGPTPAGGPPTTSARLPSYATYDVPSRKLVLSGTPTDPIVTTDKAVPNQYRIVSQGLRISLINNSQDNDGWFEAIRITPSYSETDFTVNRKPGTTNSVSNATYLAPNTEVFENGIMGTDLFTTSGSNAQRVDLSMNPSYIAGKLRDIHKHTFMLHRQENNDFTEVPRVTTFKQANGTLGTDSTTPTPVSGNITDSTNPLWYVDNKVDAILIRCRANPGTGGASLRMHLHSIQHVEECYDEASDIHRFQTTCPTNRRLLEATQNAIKKDIKPSIIRSPTLPVTSTAYSQYNRRRTKRRRW